MQICELGLSKRASNCLYRAGIRTVEELRQKRTWELQSIRSFGVGCLREVKEALERLEAAKPFTNADRIRGMSDDELAAIIMCPYDGDKDLCSRPGSCTACCAEWLRQPAAEG